MAHWQLNGVGSPLAGEWEERGDVAFHLRRRLSHKEEALIVPPVIDIRGTPEAWERVDRVRAELTLTPEGKERWESMLHEELGVKL